MKPGKDQPKNQWDKRPEELQGADTLFANGEIFRALKEYERVGRDAAKQTEARYFARLGIAACERLSGKPKMAARRIRGLKPPETFEGMPRKKLVHAKALELMKCFLDADAEDVFDDISGQLHESFTQKVRYPSGPLNTFEYFYLNALYQERSLEQFLKNVSSDSEQEMQELFVGSMQGIFSRQNAHIGDLKANFAGRRRVAATDLKNIATGRYFAFQAIFSECLDNIERAQINAGQAIEALREGHGNINHPEILPLRIRLARLQVKGGKYSDALKGLRPLLGESLKEQPLRCAEALDVVIDVALWRYQGLCEWLGEVREQGKPVSGKTIQSNLSIFEIPYVQKFSIDSEYSVNKILEELEDSRLKYRVDIKVAELEILKQIDKCERTLRTEQMALRARERSSEVRQICGRLTGNFS